jgi:chorismate synthase
MVNTTIQISQATRARLAKMKSSNESYDSLINALLDIVPTGDGEGEYTDDFRASMARALIDIRKGRTHSLEDVKRQLGLN